MSWLVDVVPPTQRAPVEAALASCSLLSLPAGSSLRAARFEGVPLLSVEDGIVAVSAGDPASSHRVVVGLAGASSILVAPVAGERVDALTDARLTLIPTIAKIRLLEITAAAAVVVDALAGGLRDCRESLGQFGSRHHTRRVREKLGQLARTYGKVGPEGLLLDIPLTHELLAEMVGSTRETVTRSLAQLAREGLVRHERGRYVIAPQRAIAP